MSSNATTTTGMTGATRPLGFLPAPSGVSVGDMSSAGAKLALSGPMASSQAFPRLNVNMKPVVAPSLKFNFPAPAPIQAKPLPARQQLGMGLATSFKLEPPKLRTSVPKGGNLLARPLGTSFVEPVVEPEQDEAAVVEAAVEEDPVEAAVVEEGNEASVKVVEQEGA